MRLQSHHQLQLAEVLVDPLPSHIRLTGPHHGSDFKKRWKGIGDTEIDQWDLTKPHLLFLLKQAHQTLEILLTDPSLVLTHTAPHHIQLGPQPHGPTNLQQKWPFQENWKTD